MPGRLSQILDKFNSRLGYRELDRKALDTSRSVASGNMGKDDNYSEWALISSDPLVSVNLVKTYITTLVSKLSGAPFRPANDQLAELGLSIRLDSIFTETYNDVLNDGYAYLGVGVDNGKPVVKPIDARYILFNGDDPSLRDATDVVVFEIVPKPLGEVADPLEDSVSVETLGTYVEFDSATERVKVSHYHRDEERNIFVLDLYDRDPENPTSVDLTGLDRIPIVRFVGERIELADKRYHYRGIYYQMSSILKALMLSATKLQIRTASSDDSNYIVRKDSISNNNTTWNNSGVKEIDNVDSNGQDIPPVQFIEHDNQFLLSVFNNWKELISDMLGPTIASGSEAVTREEVIARNEVRDAISNTYLSRMADGIEEVYRCIQMLIYQKSDEVVIYGGFIESVKRAKDMEQLVTLYKFAKEGGLNTQNFVIQMLAMSDLPSETKTQLAESFNKDPFKSPQVLQLQSTVQALNKTIEQQNQQIALLRLQATQRLERQKEFIDSTERTKRLEIALKQWTEEQKQTQEARMEVLKDCLAKQDYMGALRVVNEIQQQSSPILADSLINMAANSFSDENNQSVQQALAETAQPIQRPQTPQFTVSSPNQTQVQNPPQNIYQPKPAVTVFDDA